ncbi:type II secretion system protein [Roseateles amylovorans]|uniref:Type II secretion system protein n=1 Tax=Roseateles amylovorans TaxID=2978473 RepID=A0ABY6AW78_9BURK|nr:type II secretion system protein [Roseateles amylovorans]UXH76056.1 type II secretion system protein [Roseateles amylovorans]
MMALAVVGIAASFAVTLGATAERRDAERHLLFVGGEFERALVAYSASARRGPRELTELLRDPRFPGVRRHLRQIYADPLTGSTTWGLVRDREGFIIAVYSLARGTPIRRTGFEPGQETFADADDYAGWRFGLPIAKAVLVRPGSVTAASSPASGGWPRQP